MRTENVYHAWARSENIGDPSLSHVSTFIFRRQPRDFWHVIYLLNVVVGHGTRVVFTHMPLHSSVVTLYGIVLFTNTREDVAGDLTARIRNRGVSDIYSRRLYIFRVSHNDLE